MRLTFCFLYAALLAACGVTLDFDPQDPDLGHAGMDGGPTTDAGHGDAGLFDSGSTEAGLVDARVRDDGTIEHDATTGDGGVACTTDVDCLTVLYCAHPDATCGGPGTCTARPSTCPDVVAPVCGCDGADYRNACEAATAGVDVAYPGTCVPDGGSPDPCGDVVALSRTCTVDSECAVAIHQTNCCGSTAALGLVHAEVGLFDLLEPLCDATYPSCGCPAGPTTTDSGETTFDASSIHVTCVHAAGIGTCRTWVSIAP